MQNKKKIVSLSLAAIMVGSMMTGCGEIKTETTQQTTEIKNETSAEINLTEPGSETDAVAGSKELERIEIKEDKPDKSGLGDVTFEEITVVDNSECTIKITGVDPDDMWGFAVKAYLENKSSDKTYMFSIESASVDGVDDDPFFASSVMPGKASNETISFIDSEVAECVQYSDIKLNFRVYDDNDWNADNVAYETIHIYPYGEDKATTYKRDNADSDIVCIENDKCKFVIMRAEDDPIWGYTLKVYMENKTDEEIMFSLDGCSVNGLMMDPFWAKEIGGNCVGFSGISFLKTDFEENSITNVENVEFLLNVYDNKSYSPIIENQSVSFTP